MPYAEAEAFHPMSAPILAAISRKEGGFRPRGAQSGYPGFVHYGYAGYGAFCTEAHPRMARMRIPFAAAAVGAVLFVCGLAAAAQEDSLYTGLVEEPRAGPKRTVLFPAGDVFRPLIADPKEIRLFAGIQRGDASVFHTSFFAAGIGQRFGLLRYGNLQIGASGGVFVQFDLLAESFDMLNADFVIGLPVTMRFGRFGGRLRLYHQSSHLGDELLVRTPPVRRLNYSYEAIELILSTEVGRFRLFSGGEYLMDREHAQGSTGFFHGGLEVRSHSERWNLGIWGRVGLFGSLDVKAYQDLEWHVATATRGGLEAILKRPGPFPFRSWHLLFEVQTGPSPYGQFYDVELGQYGFALHMGL